jgi:hypothetical protein
MFNFKRDLKKTKKEKMTNRKTNYLFYSFSRDTGKSSLALSFIYFLKNGFDDFFSYIEIPDKNKEFASMPFQKLAFLERFKNREYNSFFDNNGNFNDFNIEEGINFVLATSQVALNYDLDKIKNYIISSGLTNLIFDIDSFILRDEKDYNFFFNIPGKHIIVIDCLPSKMENLNRKLDLIREKIFVGKKFLFLINKYNDFIPKKELLKYLGLKNAIFLPELNRKEIYLAEYNGIPLIENKILKPEIEKVFEIIV